MKNLLPYFIQQQYQQHNFTGRFSACSMFVDISGFTQTTEALIRSGQAEGVEVLSEILRFYFTPMVESIYGHGGFIVSFAGDAFTALFPITRPRPPIARQALRVLAAASEIQGVFAGHPVYRSKYGDFDFGVKVGLAIGDTEWGIVGREPTPNPSQEGNAESSLLGDVLSVSKGGDIGVGSLTYYFKGEAIDGCAQAEHQAEKCEIWATKDFFRLVEPLVAQKTEHTACVCIDVVTPDRFPKPVRWKPWQIDPDVLRVFYGDDLVQFRQAEFRKIVSVFVAFDQVDDLNGFVRMVLQELCTYSGTISRLDFGDKGGNLLFFFGAPVLYENTPTRALQFILSVKQALVDGGQEKVKLRAGIATGVSYCGFNGSELRAEFTCLGNAVNQSARFMMKAAWGQILVDREMAGNPQFQTRHLGDFVYKGRAAPVPTYELLRQNTLADTFYHGTMVGRERELRQLERMVNPIFQGTFDGIIYVDGVAGMGKSRLVHELRQRLEAKVTWWYLPCDEILRKSFNPIVYFLSDYFAQSEDHSVEHNELR